MLSLRGLAYLSRSQPKRTSEFSTEMAGTAVSRGLRNLTNRQVRVLQQVDGMLQPDSIENLLRSPPQNMSKGRIQRRTRDVEVLGDNPKVDWVMKLATKNSLRVGDYRHSMVAFTRVTSAPPHQDVEHRCGISQQRIPIRKAVVPLDDNHPQQRAERLPAQIASMPGPFKRLIRGEKHMIETVASIRQITMRSTWGMNDKLPRFHSELGLPQSFSNAAKPKVDQFPSVRMLVNSVITSALIATCIHDLQVGDASANHGIF